MSKTYRSLFLVCDSCKQAVDSDSKCCKHCGRPIWLKDAEKITKPVPTPIDESVEDISYREKIRMGLQKWLPVIFPENYSVAPNPMPKLKIFTEYIKKHHISEKDMDILGYGYDANTKTHFFFGMESMLYITQDIGGLSINMRYRATKEVDESNNCLRINKGVVVPVTQKRALAELLGSLTGAKVTMHNGSGTAISTGNKGGSPVPKTQYTVNDYIRDKKGFLMKLIMTVSKISLGLQCFASFMAGGNFVYAILFGIFAIGVGYHHPVCTYLALIYCILGIFDADIGVMSDYGEWFVVAILPLIIALVMRTNIIREYNRLFASDKKQ